MSFWLWRIRKAYQLRIWWRVKLPQFWCSLFRRHHWVREYNWGGVYETCHRCLKRTGSLLNTEPGQSICPKCGHDPWNYLK